MSKQLIRELSTSELTEVSGGIYAYMKKKSTRHIGREALFSDRNSNFARTKNRARRVNFSFRIFDWLSV